MLNELLLMAMNFSGLWSGHGALSGSAGYNPCEGVKIQVRQDARELTLSLRKFVCSEMEYSLEPQTFELVGGEVRMGGERVGSIDDSGMNAAWTTEEERDKKKIVTDWRATLSLENGQLHYMSSRVADGSRFQVEALLDRR